MVAQGQMQFDPPAPGEAFPFSPADYYPVDSPAYQLMCSAGSPGTSGFSPLRPLYSLKETISSWWSPTTPSPVPVPKFDLLSDVWTVSDPSACYEPYFWTHAFQELALNLHELTGCSHPVALSAVVTGLFVAAVAPLQIKGEKNKGQYKSPKELRLLRKSNERRSQVSGNEYNLNNVFVDEKEAKTTDLWSWSKVEKTKKLMQTHEALKKNQVSALSSVNAASSSRHPLVDFLINLSIPFLSISCCVSMIQMAWKPAFFPAFCVASCCRGDSAFVLGAASNLGLASLSLPDPSFLLPCFTCTLLFTNTYLYGSPFSGI